MWMEGFFSLGSHRGPLQGEDLSAESWKTKPSRRIGKGSCKAQSKAGATPPRGWTKWSPGDTMECSVRRRVAQGDTRKQTVVRL